ncbi:DUF4430 domain-containing protein [Stieleria marina]|uniref:DUF4430 domain-containing protein n=1 Tax=Stieleria marina TaxID=1930275 RepID=UPI003AF3ED19
MAPTAAPSTTSQEAVSAGTVTIQIKTDEEDQTFQAEDIADGATLESVMRSIEDLDAEISGSGLTAFVNQIKGKATSGTEGWTFTVDGEWANTGIGTTTLHPPTTVTWEFGKMKTP